MIYNKIYIGSNNETKKVEKEKLFEIISNWGYDFTGIDTIGYYKGEKENSIIIEIYGEININMIHELKRVLKQYSIIHVIDYKQVNFI
jgi:hypothetical protein